MSPELANDAERGSFPAAVVVEPNDNGLRGGCVPAIFHPRADPSRLKPLKQLSMASRRDPLARVPRPGGGKPRRSPGCVKKGKGGCPAVIGGGFFAIPTAAGSHKTLISR